MYYMYIYTKTHLFSSVHVICVVSRVQLPGKNSRSGHAHSDTLRSFSSTVHHALMLSDCSVVR